MYGSCKGDKNVWMAFRFTCTLSKFLVHFSESLTTNQCRLRDLFNFANETIEQDFAKFKVKLRFTNIPLEETIKIFTNDPFKNNNILMI